MTGLGNALTQVFALGALVGLVGIALLLAALLARRAIWAKRVVELAGHWAPPLTLAIAGVGTLGSLYYSEGAGFAPCVLCWWQRVLLYPIALISAVALVRRERGIGPYVLALAVPGMALGLYQSFLQWGWFVSSAPCDASGASCTQVYFSAFGFVTLPFLSLVAFATIASLMLALLRMRTLDPKV